MATYTEVLHVIGIRESVALKTGDVVVDRDTSQGYVLQRRVNVVGLDVGLKAWLAKMQPNGGS